MLGGFSNVEGVDLAGARARTHVVTPVDELGVPTYDELVLVAPSAGTLEENAESIRLFLAALSRGTAYAIAHPPEAANAVLSAGKGPGPDADPCGGERHAAAPGRHPRAAIRLHGSGGVGRVPRLGWRRTT